MLIMPIKNNIKIREVRTLIKQIQKILNLLTKIKEVILKIKIGRNRKSVIRDLPKILELNHLDPL